MAGRRRPTKAVIILPLFSLALSTAFLPVAHALPESRQLPFLDLDGRETEAPLVSSADSRDIDGQYIVVLKDSLSTAAHDVHHSWVRTFAADLTTNRRDGRRGADDDDEVVKAESVQASIQWNGVPNSHIRHVYTKHFRGYAGRFANHEIDRIRRSDEVSYVERDQTVHISGVQRNAPWGLSRISHQALNLGSYNRYPYDERGGENVTVYVVDTGVNTDHLDFQGRVEWGATIPVGDEDRDNNGHGTHCAGTIAGKRYGVAKKAKIIAVKVLRSNGSGSMSDVIKGVEYVGERHTEDVMRAQAQGRKHRGSVANMSLGGGPSKTLNRVVNAVVDAGVHFAVAAGNDNQDACNYSPAAAKKAITVGASTKGDERASFSNHGPCVDIFAPGKDITSTWIGSRVATNTISGTSMASPHIAGLLAYKLSLTEEHKQMPTPKELKDHLINTCTRDVLSDLSIETSNCLAFSQPPEETWMQPTQ